MTPGPIENLISEKKYLEAANQCRVILSRNPKDRKAIKLFEKAKKHIEKEREEILERNIVNIRILYKQKKYKEALDTAKKLAETGGNRKLFSLISKSERKLQAQEKKELKSYLKKGFKAHKNFAKSGKWLEALDILSEMQKVNPRNEDIKSLILSDKIKYIDSELHSNLKKELIKNSEFTKLYKFYQKLYFLFPEHKKLKKEIRKTEKLIIEQRKTENVNFIKNGENDISELMKNKEFEKALKAGKELVLFTNGENNRAKKIMLKADKENDKDTDKKLSVKLAQTIADMKAEFTKNPKMFVKL